MQPPPYQPPPYQPPPFGQPPAGHPAARERPKSWLGRHLGWAVGFGCLGLMALVVLLFAGIFGVVVTAMKASDVYAVAMHTASTDKTLIAELGAPIKAGWFVSGSINVSGRTGEANISIPVSGPYRSGSVNAVAKKSAGSWTFSVLNAQIAGRPTPVDLLPRLPP